MLVKVYGAFMPAVEPFVSELAAICSQALGDRQEADSSPVELSGNMVRISFEGIWFPVDEVRKLLEHNSNAGLDGKLDVLDLEAWRLIRMEFREGLFRESSAPLNNVLDYSGF